MQTLTSMNLGKAGQKTPSDIKVALSLASCTWVLLFKEFIQPENYFSAYTACDGLEGRSRARR